jgi:hypothetical protein
MTLDDALRAAAKRAVALLAERGCKIVGEIEAVLCEDGQTIAIYVDIGGDWLVINCESPEQIDPETFDSHHWVLKFTGALVAAYFRAELIGDHRRLDSFRSRPADLMKGH